MSGPGGRYAQNTSVPVERSRVEVEQVLAKYGATHFGTMTKPDGATIVFEFKGRQIQLAVPMPPKTDKAFTHKGWRARTAQAKDKLWEAEYRRRWRVLVITVKAMLEAVDSKLLTFDEAFLAHIVVPGTAKTIGGEIVPRLDAIYAGQLALLSENPR
jgi:hypothetical protein